MKRALIGIGVAAVLLLGGALVFRHYIMARVPDIGGMENPNATDPEVVHPLDGDFTYVNNGALLQVIVGTWESTDGGYAMTLDDDCHILITRDGETVLDDHIQFIYLQPGKVIHTDFNLDSRELKGVGQIVSLCHEAGDNGGEILLEVTRADGSSLGIVFQKTS